MNRKQKIRIATGRTAAALAFILAVWISFAVGRVDFSARLCLAAAGVCLAYSFCAARQGRFFRIFCPVCELCAAAGVAAFAAVCVSLNAFAAQNAVGARDADYAVVFGAGVRGETPSLMLTLRTRTAYEYLCAHPETRAVLSGGQGEGESIPEAEAMRRLLCGWGIAESRLILEERSTDTTENGLYSMELIREASGGGSIAAVSNAFHLRRCVQALEAAGAENVRTLSAPLPSAGAAVSMYLREFCAVVYHAVFG